MITGLQPGGRYYTLVKVTDGRAAGYSVQWTDQYNDIGRMLAALSASYGTTLQAVGSVR